MLQNLRESQIYSQTSVQSPLENPVINTLIASWQLIADQKQQRKLLELLLSCINSLHAG